MEVYSGVRLWNWSWGRLADRDSLLAKNRTVGVHDGDSPIAGINSVAAVRAVACGRIGLQVETDIPP